MEAGMVSGEKEGEERVRQGLLRLGSCAQRACPGSALDDDGGVGVVVAAVEQGGVVVDSANLFGVEEVAHWRRAVYEIKVSWKVGACAPFVTKRYISVQDGGLNAHGLGFLPQGTGLLNVVDADAPEVAAPVVVVLLHAIDDGRVVSPSTAAEPGMPELATKHFHVQHNVTVGADEVAELEGASALASEAIAVGNVAVVGQLAGAAAVGALARGGEDFGGHGLESGGHRCPVRN